MRRIVWYLLVAVTLLCAGAMVWLQLGPAWMDAAETRAHYRKYEYRVPMRDGVTLFTQVYVPCDAGERYPFLVMRTPYSVAPYGEDKYRKVLGPSASFDKAGYIFVFQDVRGRNESEGAFTEARPHGDAAKAGETDESTDMYDTAEWLLKHVANNNGNVGVWGMSYPGFYTTASMIDSHPAIKAASPEAPVTDLFLGDDAYHNGALMLAAQVEFYARFFKPRSGGPEIPAEYVGYDYGTKDGYAYFMQHGPDVKRIAAAIRNPLFDEKLQHNTYDSFWQARDISKHVHGVHCAVLTVGGWFDGEDLAGTLRTARAMDADAEGPRHLVMGPWAHGGWLRTDGSRLGPMEFGSATGEMFREQVMLPFFEHYLKGKGSDDLPKAYVFETGSNRWEREDEWPVKNAQEKTLYLRAGGKLSFEAPVKGEKEFDEYVSDPRNPVPYMEHVGPEFAAEYMYDDQSFAAKRGDVLTYVSEPLTEDVTVAGPVEPRLQVSTNGTDSDFDVKLIDLYPEGYAQLVRGEPMRAKFRTSMTVPEAMVPGEVTPVSFAMPDVNHRFLRGHRMMVQVQSSWFPLTDLNPQKFMDTAQAGPGDFVKATERVYHSSKASSGLVVRVRAGH